MSTITKGLFVYCFLKLFLKTIFENTKNTVLAFFENCSYFLNLVFSVLFVFVITKKKTVFLNTKQTCLLFLNILSSQITEHEKKNYYYDNKIVKE